MNVISWLLAQFGGNERPPVPPAEPVLDLEAMAGAVGEAWSVAMVAAFVVVFGLVIGWYLIRRIKRMGPKGWGL